MTSPSPVTLCVLLWPHPGQSAELIDYEDRVLALVPEHGGRVLNRMRAGDDESADGTHDRPLEIQVFQFDTQAGLDDYLADERRLALAEQRDRAIARTEIIPVSLVP